MFDEEHEFIKYVYNQMCNDDSIPFFFSRKKVYIMNEWGVGSSMYLVADEVARGALRTQLLFEHGFLL